MQPCHTCRTADNGFVYVGGEYMTIFSYIAPPVIQPCRCCAEKVSRCSPVLSQTKFSGKRYGEKVWNTLFGTQHIFAICNVLQCNNLQRYIRVPHRPRSPLTGLCYFAPDIAGNCRIINGLLRFPKNAKPLFPCENRGLFFHDAKSNYAAVPSSRGAASAAGAAANVKASALRSSL